MHVHTCHTQHSKDSWNALSPSVDSRLRIPTMSIRTPTTVHEFSSPLLFIVLHFNFQYENNEQMNSMVCVRNTHFWIVQRLVCSSLNYQNTTENPKGRRIQNYRETMH